MTDLVAQSKKVLARITKKSIAKTREVLGPKGENWIKGAFERPDTTNTYGQPIDMGFCLIGAHRRALSILESEDKETIAAITEFYKLQEGCWALPSLEMFFNNQATQCVNTLGLGTYTAEVYVEETNSYKLVEKPTIFDQIETFNDENNTTFDQILTALECAEKKCDTILAQPDETQPAEVQ